MSYYSNVTAFMAIGKRYTLDIKIFGRGGKPHYVMQIDVTSQEEFIELFDKGSDNLFRALSLFTISPSSKLTWDLCKYRFDTFEYRYVECFSAIAGLVFELSKD